MTRSVRPGSCAGGSGHHCPDKQRGANPVVDGIEARPVEVGPQDSESVRRSCTIQFIGIYRNGVQIRATVETSTSPRWTSCRPARASNGAMVETATTRFSVASMLEMSMYRNGLWSRTRAGPKWPPRYDL